MPKLKMPKKSTSIDMTALCDFTLLLLTFFIMSAKFKPQEAVEVVPPSSTSTKEIPMGFVQITVDKDGRVFYTVDNIKLKRALIDEVNNTKSLGLTEVEKNNFVNGPSVGVPFAKLKGYLALSPNDQSRYDKDAPGVPTDTTKSFTTNELMYWINSTRYQAKVLDMDQPRFVIKVDGQTPYVEQTNRIISTLGRLDIYRFSYITNQRAVPQGTALWEKNNATAQN
jgi:biopolymer transport protein ExbD